MNVGMLWFDNRRLAEKKGSPRIDWEIVLCMEKPLPDGAV